MVEKAPRQLTGFLYAGSAQSQVMAVFNGADDSAAIKSLTPLLDVASVLGQSALRVLHAGDAPYQGGSTRGPLLSNEFAEHLTPDISGEIAEALRSGVMQRLSIRAVGGAVKMSRRRRH